ncbi:MAG: M17 family peptidase N-terminal domain-containing protein, partial [Gammaproteobacteria bacterium]
MALRFLPSQSPVHTDASDCVVVGAFSDKTFSPSGTALDAAAGGRLKALAERGDISGKTGQTLLLQDVPGVASARVLVIGLGDPEKFAVPQYLKAIADAVRALRSGPVKSVYLTLSDLPVKGRDAEWAVRQTVIAADHAAYEYTATRSKKASVTLSEVSVHVADA